MDASPYGLTALWSQGDVVTKAVAILLTMMSMASWYVILTKALQLLRYRAPAQAAGHAFWQADNVAAGVSCLGRDNPFVALASAGQGAVDHHTIHQGQLQDRLPVSEWVTLSLRQAIDEASASLQSGMAVLASVGSTAPFVGLFGTVWGIYHALVSIGSSGQASIDKVAGPVGEALVMTAVGLTVAIPAVLAYNGFNRVNRLTLAELDAFAHDLHAYLTTGARAGK